MIKTVNISGLKYCVPILWYGSMEVAVGILCPVVLGRDQNPNQSPNDLLSFTAMAAVSGIISLTIKSTSARLIVKFYTKFIVCIHYKPYGK